MANAGFISAEPNNALVCVVDRVRRPPGFDAIGRHHHSFYEMLYYTDGHLTMFIKDRSYQLGTGDLILINMLDMHSSTYPPDRTTERVMVRFNSGFLRNVLGDALETATILGRFKSDDNVIHLAGPERGQLEGILDRMLRESQSQARDSVILSRLYLGELLVMIGRLSKDLFHTDRAAMTVTESTVSSIAAYIRANHADDLSLTSLAERFCMSRCYLARLFKKHSGFTVVQYINLVRVSEAARLLAPSVRVSDVAMQVGFSNLSHFGKVFRKCMGTSPRRYRSNG